MYLLSLPLNVLWVQVVDLPLYGLPVLHHRSLLEALNSFYNCSVFV